MTKSTKLSYWYCKNCRRDIFHGEFRFNCTVCNNYDYCEQCAAALGPTHSHRMIRELAYGCAEGNEIDITNMATGIRIATTLFCDRHCMGVRDIDRDNPSYYTDSYSWLTFKTVGDRSKNFGHGLRRLIAPREYLGICAANRPEWMITDFACMLQSIITVPIYILFNDREIAYVINNTQVSVIVCDKQRLPRFIELYPLCPSLRHIVCIDSILDTTSSKSNVFKIDHLTEKLHRKFLKRFYFIRCCTRWTINSFYGGHRNVWFNRTVRLFHHGA